MDLTPSDIQSDGKKLIHYYRDLIFETVGNTADGIFGSQTQDLFIVNPVIPVSENLRLIIPPNIADQQKFNYSIKCVVSARAIVTGTGGAGTYVGPFAVPIGIESYGNIPNHTKTYIFINGGSPLTTSFLSNQNIIRIGDKINFLQINSGLAANFSQGMQILQQNAYFIPDISSGDWSIQAIVQFQILAELKNGIN